MDYRVTCATKRTNSHEGITNLGGPGFSGTKQQVIASINAGNTFYVLANNKRSDVGIVDGPNGQYLRTHADGYYNDNLLALPNC